MPKRKSLTKPRRAAFYRQNGRCCYCHAPMWLGDTQQAFIRQYNLSPKQAAALQCTGEHLKAHQDGGDERPHNIAAACRCCNQRRHQRKHPLDVNPFRDYVQRRLELGRWHPSPILRLVKNSPG